MSGLNNNKAFCILPFIHLHVDERNDVKLCCVASQHTVDKYSTEFDFKTNPALQQVRQDMLDGKRVPHCKTCYEFDDGGTDSLRTRENKEWSNTLGINDIKQVSTDLIYYDVRNDNLCNLGCRMCGPQSSSQLEKEFIEIGWPISSSAKSFGFNDVIDLDTVKRVYVAGGEPSIMPTFKQFLKRAVESGKTDFELRMNTNATNLNKEYRDLLKNFKSLHITVSLDGYDQINRYIRWPSDWDTIIKNVHGLYEITEQISFNVTVSIWNISNLSQLVFALEKEFSLPDILLNRVTYPASNECTTFPNKELAITDLVKIKESRSYNGNISFRSKIDYYISEMQNSKLNKVALWKFFKYNDSLDKSRNIKLHDYIPELEICRELITKQI